MRFGKQPCSYGVFRVRTVCSRHLSVSTQRSSPVTVNQKIQYRGEEVDLELCSK